MAAACPDHDRAAATEVRLVSDVEVDKRTTQFTLRFANPSSTDILVSHVRVSRGFNTSGKQKPSPLQVFPHFFATVVVELTITSCKSAIEDISPTTIDFAVSNADRPDQVQNVSAADPTYAEALGRLVYRACAKA
jgi:hypothetical protein